jgi:hypothetical protein
VQDSHEAGLLFVEWRVGFFFMLRSGFSAGGSEGVVNGFCGAALAGFGGFVIEDSEQVIAALGGSEPEPGIAGAGAAQKDCAEDGGRIVLSFQGLHEHLGNFLSALDAGGRGFGLVCKFAEFAATGVAHRVEDSADLTVGIEGADEFRRERNGTLDEVGLQSYLNARADADAGGGLHLLIDEEEVAAVSGIGEERGVEVVACDLAAHSTAIADWPRFGDVEGDTGNDPFERGSIRLEERGEGFAR